MLRKRRSCFKPTTASIVAMAALAFWVLLQTGPSPKPRLSETELRTVPSIPAQLLFAFGDRFLAANIAAWRATVIGGSGLSAETYAALSKVQENAAWLNPAHEDNYYTASAVLPWEGYVDAAQTILWRATESRQTDLLPPFLYGFNQLNFRGDVSGAVKALRVAEGKALTDGEREYFREMANRWEARGDDLSFPRRLLGKMASTARTPSLKTFLTRQLTRLEGLALLRDATRAYMEKFGRNPDTLEQLTQAGFLAELPYDSTGLGYELRNGVVFLRSRTNEGG